MRATLIDLKNEIKKQKKCWIVKHE
jgi:hypothetical protein